MQLEKKLLPDIDAIRCRSQALAMLDAIISPEWEDRYYSFDTNWSEGEEMASMRNGSGDDWFILFTHFGAAIKGFAHETTIARDKSYINNIQSQIPQEFSSFLTEPAFSMDYASFCFWRKAEESSWNKVTCTDPELVKTDDGSIEYLSILIESATSYEKYAEECYEVSLPLSSIDSIYTHAPLTEKLVKSINKDTTLNSMREFASEIGYPIEDA